MSQCGYVLTDEIHRFVSDSRHQVPSTGYDPAPLASNEHDCVNKLFYLCHCTVIFDITGLAALSDKLSLIDFNTISDCSNSTFLFRLNQIQSTLTVPKPTPPTPHRPRQSDAPSTHIERHSAYSRRRDRQGGQDAKQRVPHTQHLSKMPFFGALGG